MSDSTAHRFWFRPKRYGYGATPVTWQGWLVTFALTLLIAGGVAAFRAGLRLPGLLCFVGVGGALMFIRARTAGGWRWRWGRGG